MHNQQKQIEKLANQILNELQTVSLTENAVYLVIGSDEFTKGDLIADIRSKKYKIIKRLQCQFSL